MRLHRNLVLASINAAYEIFTENKYADKVVAAYLKSDKRWGSHDRKFVAETVYDMVRWKRLYAAIAEAKEPFGREDMWRLFAVWATLKGLKLPDWKQFEGTPSRKIKGRFDELSKQRAYRESIPDWMDEIGAKELGEDLWNKELAEQNKTAQVVLRANRLLTDAAELQKKLAAENIDTKTLKDQEDTLVLVERANVFMTEAFKEGLFEVQDASSQLVAPFLELQPGMKVIDACAGAGGKTLHMASIMQNKGQIIALDLYESKMKQLKIRAKRSQAFNIEYRIIENSKVIKKLHDKADRVLIDAPCSGLGVLKRNPDSKWKLKPEFINNIKQTQREVLENYTKMVKVDGLVVYATCSILPSENQEQIKWFLASEWGQNFKLVDQKIILSHQTGFDGFFMAKMQRIK